MARTRVLIVEDSLTVRKYLVDVLSADPAFDVVGEAEDGRTAIELCRALRPDVITMDMMLPVMTGLATTEYIMAHMPTPILIVSASTNRGELFRTYEALAAGALDVLDKPLSGEANALWERKLVDAVKMVARIKVITHLRGRSRHVPLDAPVAPLPRDTASVRLVAIGTSTGGPAAVATVLQSLPADFPLPILLVLHIGAPFGTAFAEWLDGVSSQRVRIARDGEPLPGIGERGVCVAPPEKHLVVRDGRLRLTDDPPRHSCRPSVDVLFESLAVELGPAAAGFLLTGMGRDGAAGLLAMRTAGAHTFAQDEATSVVFGMPMEAARLGAAKCVVPLDAVAGEMVDLAATNRTSRRP